MRYVPDGAASSALGGGSELLLLPNRLSMKLPGPRAAAAYCGPQLFCAERRQHRAALIFAVGAADAAAAQALEAGRDLLEIGAHLLDLVVDRRALRRLAVEQREEARAFAAHPLGLLRDAIEFALLLGLGFLIAADLFILGGVAGAGATVDRRQLPFEPDADRIGLRALLLGAVAAAGRGSSARRQAHPRRRCRAAWRRSKSSGRGELYVFPAYPAIES